MAHLRQVELMDLLPQLPDVEPLDIKRDFFGKEDDLFLCALGFEDRCLWIPELIIGTGNYRCKEAVYFEYATNLNDNESNRPRLINALQQLSTSLHPMPCNKEEFANNLRESLSRLCAEDQVPNVAFDISSCSSSLLLLVLKVLFEFNLSLRIVYSEAEVYHPTHEEYIDDPEKWTTEEGFGLTRGVGTVVPSAEHPRYRLEKLPEAVIVFPTFKPERAKAIITDIDESLIMNPKDRVIWIVGIPHLPEDNWRTDAIREINKIPNSAPSYDISTFHYKNTLEVLERIQQQRDGKHHINIAPLGSKMQSLGINLFWYMRQDVSITFATPKEYNARQYSDGCKAISKIEFGRLKTIREILDRVGQLEIIA